MLKRLIVASTTAMIALATTAQTALAQRPPSGNQAPPQISLDSAWAWLMARPGVLISLAIIVAALAYMFVTRKKPTT